MQHILIQRNGRIYVRLIFVVALIFIFFLNSCSSYWFVGDGRGDWSTELLGGFYITKVNSYEILVTYKETPVDVSATIVVPKYFVDSYQVQGSYIILKGIKTEGTVASKKELNDMILSYYIICVENSEILGPFDTYDEFYDKCKTLELDITRDWVKTQGTEKTGDGGLS